MRYVFVIDKKRCIGCHTCAVACRYENNLPANVWWNKCLTEGGTEMDTPAGTFPNVTMQYYTMACQHCENPACTEACPTGATYKDPETGIVRQNAEQCIGCQSCINACPYEGVRTFIADEPEYYIDIKVGDPAVPEHLAATVEKCTMCAHRVDRGEVPMCVKVCPAVARFWGDIDDPESEVAKLLATREYEQMNVEAGTNPSVYYLI